MNPLTLNPPQFQAVSHRDSHLLIIAGPGTGKTHTLTHRIIEIAKELKNNERILAITFTNKAAQEMKERLQKHMFPLENKVFVGTFHSFCLKLLRQFIDYTDLPKDFRVVSPEEKVQLNQNEFLDFDEILVKSLELIQKNEAVRKYMKETYRYICVDEYQDINAIQHDLMKEWVAGGAPLTAIGDPHQAIYGFRGSDVSFFENFTEDFPGAVILTLKENYRSAPKLLKASGQMMRAASRATSMCKVELARALPELVAAFHRAGKLIISPSPTDKAEAEFVVHQIEKMVGGLSMFSQDSQRVDRDCQGERSFGEIAVLYRLNVQNRLLKEALNRSGIPFQVSGENSLTNNPTVGEIIRVLNISKDVNILNAILAEGKWEGKKIPQEILQKLQLCAEQSQSVAEFLDAVALQTPEDSFESRAEKVSLMTLHAAKGLEFPVVFIVGCEDNLLPLRIMENPSDQEEERRLFYVGMTRAKECLYLCWAQKRLLYGKFCEQSPSPFLSDIEESLKFYEETERPKTKSKEKQLNLFG